jgi:predicted TIM-barrel fold metal-dependent hydrolase
MVGVERLEQRQRSDHGVDDVGVFAGHRISIPPAGTTPTADVVDSGHDRRPALRPVRARHRAGDGVRLDALATSGGRYRGVALVTAATDPGLIVEWAAAGVCGTRLTFLPHLGGAPSAETIAAVVGLIRPHGWHLSVHVAGSGITNYAGVIAGIDVPVVIDHMARIDIARGDADAESLLRLLDTGNVWVKLSGADRLSGGPRPSPAAIAFARRLALHAPVRVVWGTDFPHPNIAGDPPDDGMLVDTLADLAPEPDLRRRLLVDNPARLFGWSAQ